MATIFTEERNFGVLKSLKPVIEFKLFATGMESERELLEFINWFHDTDFVFLEDHEILPLVVDVVERTSHEDMFVVSSVETTHAFPQTPEEEKTEVVQIIAVAHSDRAREMFNSLAQ